MSYRALWIAVMALAATACGKGPYLDLGDYAPYVDRFEAAAASTGHSVTVTYLVIHTAPAGSLGENTLGMCTYSEPPLVQIDEKFWASASEASRELLIFHELGHCVLGRGHTTETVQERFQSRPASVMFPYLFNDGLYQQYRAVYLAELFGGVN